MTPWCLIPNLILYTAASLLYLAVPLTTSRRLTEGKRLNLEKTALVLTGFGLSLHLFYLFLGHPAGLLAFLSAGLLLLFFWLVWRHRWEGVGPFFVPAALILFLLSLKQGKTDGLFLAALAGKTFFVRAHLVFAGLSFLFFASALLVGIVAFVLEKRLKNKQMDVFSLSLPPLMVSEKKVRLWLRLGFVFLTLVLMSGAFLLKQTAMPRAMEGGHILLALAAWGLYGWLLRRKGESLHSKNLLLLSATGFVSLFALLLWK